VFNGSRPCQCFGLVLATPTGIDAEFPEGLNYPSEFDIDLRSVTPNNDQSRFV
jgi:hypothetical protein